VFYYPLQIRPHPDGRHCGDCAKLVVYDGCHCAVSEFFEDPKQDDLEYESDFLALRCTRCLEAEREWRERGKILIQCSLCKGEWDSSDICSCCGDRFFPTGYLPINGPMLVPCPECKGVYIRPDGHSCKRCTKHLLRDDGLPGYTPGWVLLR
jgi:hypothetical protein